MRVKQEATHGAAEETSRHQDASCRVEDVSCSLLLLTRASAAQAAKLTVEGFELLYLGAQYV